MTLNYMKKMFSYLNNRRNANFIYSEMFDNIIFVRGCDKSL